MLSSEEEIFCLKGENKRLKEAVRYLDSLNQNYVQFLRQLNVKIENAEHSCMSPDDMKVHTIHDITIIMPPISLRVMGNSISNLRKDIESFIKEVE